MSPLEVAALREGKRKGKSHSIQKFNEIGIEHHLAIMRPFVGDLGLARIGMGETLSTPT